jgi:hypothetical protein
MMFMNIVFLFPSSPQFDVAGMNYTVVVFGGVMALSLVWYYLPIYGGVHWFTGPVRNITSPPVPASVEYVPSPDLNQGVSSREEKKAEASVKEVKV